MKTILSLLYIGSFFFLFTQTAGSVEYAVPNGGSPYTPFNVLKEGEILHIPTGTPVTQEQMIDAVSGARVIYVSEIHDNIESHKAQLAVIQEMQLRFPGKIAVGMEMFRRPSQEKIDLWIQGKLDHHEFYLLWNDNWGEGYENYQDILTFIKKNNIPLIALKPGKDIETAFRNKGPDGLSADEKKKLPVMDQNDEYHKIFADAVFGGHRKSSHAILTRPYQTLLLWEEAMAENVANFLTSPQGADKKLIVLAGTFHVEYGFGIPKRAYRRVPHSYSTILPLSLSIPLDISKGRVMEVKPTFIPLYFGDYVWNVAYNVLGENRILLGVSLKSSDNGLTVMSVKENSNAMAAGIQTGDVIVAMDDHPAKDITDLKALLSVKKIGDLGSVKIIRNKKELLINVKFNK